MVTNNQSHHRLEQKNGDFNLKTTTNYIEIDEENNECHLTKQLIEKTNTISESVIRLYNKKKRRRIKILGSLDIIISFVIVAPCVVGGWRGLWELFLLYSEIFPPWDCFLIGNGIHLIFAILQDDFNNILNRGTLTSLSMKIIYGFLLKIYICVFYVTTLLTWYGGWEVYDIIIGVTKNEKGTAMEEGSETSNVTLVIVLLVMVLLKLLRNNVSVPFEIALDHTDEILLFPSYFKCNAGEKTSLYILDCLFSVLVVGTLVVFVWRGAWVLIDIFLFPENEKLSAWGSLIIGYVTVAIAFLMQPVMRWICDRATGAFRLFVADFFILFAFFGTVNVWRGIWNLLNLYFLPDNLELSCWITHWVCLIILLLLGCSNSLLVRGVYIDAEEPAGKCVVFPCYYLRTIFKYEKKNSSKLQLQENNKSQNSEKKLYENNHIVNIGSLENVIENHTKL